jgi:hypothetical protein
MLQVEPASGSEKTMYGGGGGGDDQIPFYNSDGPCERITASANRKIFSQAIEYKA